MKKVLYVATVDVHIRTFHLSYLKMLHDNGYEVHVITNGDEQFSNCDVKHRICIERRPFKLNNLKAVKQLKQIVDEEKFDLIHCHTPMGAVVTRLAARHARKKYGTRVIYTAHGFHFFKGAPRWNWIMFYPIEKYLAKYTDTLITINEEDYELAKRKFSHRCHDIQHFPGIGIDGGKFDYEISISKRKEILNSVKLSEKDFIMIYPAEISNRKRQEWLIKSISRLLKEYNDIKLLLPGIDSLNGKCSNLVKELNLEEQVLLLGFRDDVPDLLKISDLALSSASQEGLPVNIMEALYVGLPIVASNCRGNRDLVKNGVNGFVVDINDSDGFSNAIVKIYKNKEKYTYDNKKEVEKYLLKNIIAQMEKIYFKDKT